MNSIAPAEASNESLFSPAWRSLSIGAISLCSMMAFEGIGVAAGMPAVATALGGMSFYALAFASTLAASVVAMVYAGLDCDRNGPFRSMAGGLLFFATGLLVAGLAGSMWMLIVGRIIQGLGMGALGVALYVATARALPPKLLPRLFALFSSAWVLPAIIGPAISGYIVQALGWRWLFLGILLLLLPTAGLILPSLHRAKEAPMLDKVGQQRFVMCWAMLAALSCVGLSMSSIGEGWAPAMAVIAVVMLLTSCSRLLPSGTLRLAPGLPTVIALRGLMASAFFLCEAFVPLWLHLECAWSISAAGFALTSGGLSWSIGSHLQSRINVEAKRRIVLRHGGILLCLGVVISVSTVMKFWPAWMLLIGWTISGLGVGISLPMLGVLTLQLAPKEQQGTYSSALQLSGALCTSAVLAAGGVLFSWLQGQSMLMAYLSVFALAAVIAVLALMSVRRVFLRLSW
jgi:MFS family permease